MKRKYKIISQDVYKSIKRKYPFEIRVHETYTICNLIKKKFNGSFYSITLIENHSGVLFHCSLSVHKVNTRYIQQKYLDEAYA